MENSVWGVGKCGGKVKGREGEVRGDGEVWKSVLGRKGR